MPKPDVQEGTFGVLATYIFCALGKTLVYTCIHMDELLALETSGTDGKSRVE